MAFQRKAAGSRFWPLLAIGALVACADGSSGDPAGEDTAPAVEMPDAVPATVAYLKPTQHLVRASMALRGLRPALDELRAVEEDPSVLPALRTALAAEQNAGARAALQASVALLDAVHTQQRQDGLRDRLRSAVGD